MLGVYAENDILLSMMDTLVGEGIDLSAAEKAFESTRGNFTAKFRAAVEARFAELVRPELFIEVPEQPEELRKSELDALVRPASGYLRSYLNKDELVSQARSIKQRQDERPSWMPRLNQDGQLVPKVESSDPQTPRIRVLSTFPELGNISITLPPSYEERPELPMLPGGIGEWESALTTVLGITDARGPSATIDIDAAANEALVPEDVRWWTSEPAVTPSATQDSAVASELLATLPTLGGLTVVDDELQAHDALEIALCSAESWRYSPRWRLHSWRPGDDVGALTTARVAVAAWAAEGRSGLLVYVYGGALHATDGLLGFPMPLHSYLLCVTRAADGTDTIEAVHRMVISCPSEGWCHRGGCPTGILEAAVLLTPIVTAGESAAAADQDAGWAGEAYRHFYGAEHTNEYEESVLDHLELVLEKADWTMVNRSEWEGGLDDMLLRRGEHLLLTTYDPVTRQLRLADGMDEGEFLLQMLSEEGILAGEEGHETVDTGDTAVEQWGQEILTTAEDLLRERITKLKQLSDPLQSTLLGLHPQADGTMRAPEAVSLAEKQFADFLRAAGLLSVKRSGSGGGSGIVRPWGSRNQS